MKPCMECGVAFKRGEFEAGEVYRKRIYCSNACIQKVLNRMAEAQRKRNQEKKS